MAYTGTVTLRGNAGAAGTSSGATGSFTPSAGETLIAWVLARNASAYPVNSITDSLGGSWTRLGSADFQGPATNAFVSVGLFYQVIGGSPAAMTVTGTSSNGSTTAVLVVSATALATVTNFAGYPSATTPNTGTLTGDAILTYNGRQTTSTVTTPTGYTALIASTGYNAQLAHRAAYDLSSPGTQNWTTGNNNVTVSLELVDAGGGGPIAGTTSISLSPTGALSGVGALSGQTSLALAPTATISATGALAAATSLSLSPTGTLQGTGVLSGTASIAFSLTGTLQQPSGSMAGSTSITIAPAGVLSGAGALAGATSITFAPSGTLVDFVPAGAMSGTTSIAFTLSGNLSAARIFHIVPDVAAGAFPITAAPDLGAIPITPDDIPGGFPISPQASSGDFPITPEAVDEVWAIQ